MSYKIPKVSLTADVTGVLPVANGGTNLSTYTTGDILYASAANVLSKLPTGSNGQVLILSGGLPTWGTSTNVTTINGDSGSITGSTVKIYANNASLGCGSSVLFTNSSTTSTLSVTDGLSNSIMGSGAGKAGISGANNSGWGRLCLASLTSGDSNQAIGSTSLTNCTSGHRNCAVGVISLKNLTTGTQNTGIGNQSLENITTGSNNIAIGYQAGISLTTSNSTNILIGNVGVAGDNAAIKIGTNGTHTSCAIQGISGVTVTGSAVICSTAGVLGTVVSSKIFKENIESIDDKVSILKLEPKKFNYISDDQKNCQYGLIAEEVDTEFSYLCLYDENKMPFSVKYHEIPTLLLLEIKRLEKRVTELEKKMSSISD